MKLFLRSVFIAGLISLAFAIFQVLFSGELNGDSAIWRIGYAWFIWFIIFLILILFAFSISRLIKKLKK